VAQLNERLANRTASVLGWYDTTATEHTTSGSNEDISVISKVSYDFMVKEPCHSTKQFALVSIE